MKQITFFILFTLYWILSWLMDLWGNIQLETQNGFFKNLFGLNLSISHHVVWYLSMIIFMIFAYDVLVNINKK